MSLMCRVLSKWSNSKIPNGLRRYLYVGLTYRKLISSSTKYLLSLPKNKRSYLASFSGLSLFLLPLWYSSVNGRFRVETTEVRRVHVHSSLLVVTSNQNASNKKKNRLNIYPKHLYRMVTSQDRGQNSLSDLWSDSACIHLKQQYKCRF
jgi:hypothetical protein